MLKILHTADWHSNCNYDSFVQSADFIKDYIKYNDVDLMVHSGDVFDSKIIASDLYNKIINKVIEFADIVPIFMVYGTPSHDYKNSLDVLKTVKTKFPIYIVDSMKDSIAIYSKKLKQFYTNDIQNKDDSVLLIGCPWQTKSRFLTDKEQYDLSNSDQQTIFKKRFKAWRNLVLKKQKECDLTSILVAHLQLIGSFPSSGQDISSDNHDPKDYYDLCDYGALGHIHKTQNFKNLTYAGSIYNKTWGELDDKFFYVIEIENNEISLIKPIKIPTPVMLKIVCDIDEYKVIKKDAERFEIKNGINIFDLKEKTNLWIIVNVENTKILNLEKEQEFWKDKVNVIRLEFSKIKTDTIQRLEEYSKDISLVEKFKLWCKQKNETPSEFQINKIKNLEHE